jgi:hypothetical protein
MVMVSFHYLEQCPKVVVPFVFFSIAVMVALGSNVVNPFCGGGDIRPILMILKILL